MVAAVRAGAITVAAVQLADGLLLGVSTPALLVINVPTAVVAIGLLLVMRQSGSARRNPIVAVLLLGALAIEATLLPAVLVPALAPRMLPYLPIVVVASALFVPWAVRWHAPWLATVLVVAAVFDLTPVGQAVQAAGYGSLFPVTFAAAVTSLAGHALLQRERRRSFGHRLQVRGMTHAARQQRRELQALADQLEAVAGRDPLTGIGNRLRLNHDVMELRQSLEAGARSVAAVLVDIDHFKDYNDEHGHLAGDVVLREVARTIAINIRPSDRVYRFGGEEFVVLLLDTDGPGAVLAAERIREAVETLAVVTPANRPWGVLTVSAGVASVDLADPRTDEWIRIADERLYASKAGGRNRVTGPSGRPIRRGRVAPAEKTTTQARVKSSARSTKVASAGTAESAA
jgi:diguanylate cyclase (GGDEF)-like protein